MNNKERKTATKEMIRWVWKTAMPWVAIIISLCVLCGMLMLCVGSMAAILSGSLPQQGSSLPQQGSDALWWGKILVGGFVWIVVLVIILLIICAISDGYYWTKPDEPLFQIVMGKVMSIVPGVGLFLLAWIGTHALGNAMIVSSSPHATLWSSIGFPVVLLGSFILLFLFLMPGIGPLKDKLEEVDWTRLLCAHRKTKC